MKKLIKNGTIVTATDTYKADILIEEWKNHQQSAQIYRIHGAEIIDAKGCYRVPRRH